MTEEVYSSSKNGSDFLRKPSLAWHGWVGIGLIALCWPLDWLMPGIRTAWFFFPLWLGYCLTIDALVLRLRGSSLASRSWRRYIGLFLISAPAWWVFEILNYRIQNWEYLGNAFFSPLGFFLLATINFSVVIPAIFGAAELFSGTRFVRNLKPWTVMRLDRRSAIYYFAAGWLMLAVMLAWPKIFFPFMWLSVLFILEPINIWLGHHSLAGWLKQGDWRPVVSLCLGALFTGFFWEMWNFFSYPKWIYHVPGVSFVHIFEMPLLGYLGYLPFALELYALYHLVMGLRGQKSNDLIHVGEISG